MSHVKPEKSSETTQSEQVQLTLTPASQFKFGLVDVKAKDSEQRKKKGTIVRDILRHGILDDSSLAKTCFNELQKLQKQKDNEAREAKEFAAIQKYFSARYGVTLSDSVLRVFDQRLCTEVVTKINKSSMQQNYLVHVGKGVSDNSGDNAGLAWKASLGVEGNSVYATITTNEFTKKTFDNISSKLPGELQLVYKINNETGDFEAVGYHATGAVAKDLMSLPAPLSDEEMEVKEHKTLQEPIAPKDLTSTKTDPIVLNLSVKKPPASRSLFHFVGIFCSRLTEFFWNRFKPKAPPETKNVHYSADSDIKPQAPSAFATILAARASVRKNKTTAHIKPAAVITTRPQPSPAPAKKSSILGSLRQYFTSAQQKSTQAKPNPEKSQDALQPRNSFKIDTN